jgi:hypothetical protein
LRGQHHYPKSNTEIEGDSKLFDRAAQNGSRYLDDHCFVNRMLCVPVWDNVASGKTQTFSYLSVPLGYHMWWKKNNQADADRQHGVPCHAHASRTERRPVTV